MEAVAERTYKYAELSESAKIKAVEKLGTVMDYEWWDCIYDDAKAYLHALGYVNVKIVFSGFCCQGDGASFTGGWAPHVDLDKFKTEYGGEELLALGDRMAVLLVEAKLLDVELPTVDIYNRSGHSHEMAPVFDVNWKDDNETPHPFEEQFNDRFVDLSRDLMRYIYRCLREEHEYLYSRERVEEDIDANDYSFDEDGNLV